MTWILSGRFLRPNSESASGYVRVVSEPAVVVDAQGNEVFVSPATATLDADGRFEMSLPWSDDATLSEPPSFTIAVNLDHRTLTPLQGVEVNEGVDRVDYADLMQQVLGPTMSERLLAVEMALAGQSLTIQQVETRMTELDQSVDDRLSATTVWVEGRISETTQDVEARIDATVQQVETRLGETVQQIESQMADLDQRLTQHTEDPDAHDIPERFATIDGGTL